MAIAGVREDREYIERRLAYRARLIKDGTILRPSIEGAKYMKGSNKMSAATKWTMDVCGDVESIELAATVKSRLRGMLFRDPDDITRLLIPCHDIHTFGMQYPLDIAFISREGKVLEVHRNVECRKRIRRTDASLVAERFSRAGDWLCAGDVIHLGVRK